MDLSTGYVEYLKDRTSRPVQELMASLLDRAGYALEAVLLRCYARQGEVDTRIVLSGSAFTGRRAFVGPRLPQGAAAGDLWFDTAELMPMLLLPRPAEDLDAVTLRLLGPCVSFLAVRAVASWQYRAFLRVARFAPHQVQIPPPFRLLDEGRIFQGQTQGQTEAEETAPVTRLTHGEARLYALWLGKGLSSLEDFQAAARHLTPAAYVALWGAPGREWMGDRCSSDEGARVVASPDTVEQDLDEVYERELAEGPAVAPDRRMLYGERSLPLQVGFRTHVSTQLGLYQGVAPDPGAFDDVRLVAQLERG